MGKLKEAGQKRVSLDDALSKFNQAGHRMRPAIPMKFAPPARLP